MLQIRRTDGLISLPEPKADDLSPYFETANKLAIRRLAELAVENTFLRSQIESLTTGDDVVAGAGGS